MCPSPLRGPNYLSRVRMQMGLQYRGWFRARCFKSSQAVLPCAETVPMLLWALLASGQISMRKVDGWQTLDKAIEPMTLDLAA